MDLKNLHKNTESGKPEEDIMSLDRIRNNLSPTDELSKTITLIDAMIAFARTCPHHKYKEGYGDVCTESGSDNQACTLMCANGYRFRDIMEGRRDGKDRQ